MGENQKFIFLKIQNFIKIKRLVEDECSEDVWENYILDDCVFDYSVTEAKTNMQMIKRANDKNSEWNKEQMSERANERKSNGRNKE